jgi:hypothetical protein
MRGARCGGLSGQDQHVGVLNGDVELPGSRLGQPPAGVSAGFTAQFELLLARGPDPRRPVRVS